MQNFGQFGSNVAYEAARTARQVVCCAVLICCSGPIMIVIGVVCLALASADSRGHNLATFNNAKIAWAAKGGGAQQFSNAFVTSGAPSLSFTVPGGTSFTVPLTSSTQPSALADKGGDAKGSYAPVTFYTGTVPGGAWPNSTSAGSNSQFSVMLSNTTVPAVSFYPYKCVNTQSSSGSGCGSNKGGTCTYSYYRVFSYLSVADLRVVLPDACSTGSCTPTKLVFSTCSQYSQSPQVTSVSITQAQFSADGGVCASLGPTTLTPTVLTPTFNIRASNDPFALANDLTLCTTLFGPTAKSYRISGVGLLIAGVLISALMLFIVVKKFCLSKPQQQQVLPAWEMGNAPFPKAPQQQLPPSYAPGGYAPQAGYAQPGYAAQPQQYGAQQPQQYGAPQYGGPAPGMYAPPQGGYAPQGYGQAAYSAPGYRQY